MAFYSFSGTKFHIGTALAFQQTDFVVGDFAGVTWTEVQDIEQIGSYGDTANYGTFSVLGTRREFSYLTTFGNSPTELVMARNPADAGQAAILTASATPNATFAIKITMDDAPVDGTPSVDYAIAKFSPMQRLGGSNSDVLKWRAQFAIASNVVAVAAAEAP